MRRLTITDAERRLIRGKRPTTKRGPSAPVNTLEKSLHLARTLADAVRKREGKAYRSYRLFAALAPDHFQALAAFFIWRGRGEFLKEFFCEE